MFRTLENYYSLSMCCIFLLKQTVLESERVNELLVRITVYMCSRYEWFDHTMYFEEEGEYILLRSTQFPFQVSMLLLLN